jgi:hypothetical protein
MTWKFKFRLLYIVIILKPKVTTGELCRLGR